MNFTSVRKARPISIFIHPQESLSKNSIEASSPLSDLHEDLSMILNNGFATTMSSSNATTASTTNYATDTTSTANTIATSNNITSTPHILENVITPASEIDVASLNSVKTIETNQTGSNNGSFEMIKTLCELDGGLGAALERVKQDAISAKASAIEESYGRELIKLAKNTQDKYLSKSDTKKGSYGDCWIDMMKLHESVGENRIRFAATIQEISDEALTLYKDTDKSRKNLYDSGQKHVKSIQEAERSLEKARGKYESNSEDWERLILLKNGDTLPPSMKSKTLKTIFSKQPKSPTQYSKMEEDARNKAAAANRYYKSQLSGANLMRNEYYNIHLPRIITELKSVADECDAGLQYHLARYSYLYESAMVSDASAISPVDLEDGPALRTIVEQINNDSDYLNYVQSFKKKSQKLKINEIPYNQYNMSEQAINIINPTNPKPVFGTDLSELMKRDGGVIPIILRKCVTAVEKYGLESLGIYRLSGVTSQVQSLKSLFDKDAESVDLDSEENLKDINNVSSLLKLWFRELPDPLFPRTMYQDFINAAKINDEKQRVLKLHQTINNLPDANYISLNYLMEHLDKLVANQEYNKMSVKNLAIVFGPTLFGNGGNIGTSNNVGNSVGGVQQQNPISESVVQFTPSSQSLLGIAAASQQQSLIDMMLESNDTSYQCKVVETILSNYKAIFVQDES
ncbi:5675_t:CDS:10 [Entrophospora sp. SA101]|nr:5675_t:CDS:10 [Entrophospora sp. SA101]CAJ0911143.1 21409_t:CDS:10 [Entrophospora sp. SA101]